MLYIALHSKNNEKIGIKPISEGLNIPSPFLGKILQVLSKKKILNSSKGPHGGFSLRKDVDDICMIEIVEAIDGLDFFNSCIIGLNSCTENPNEAPCPLHNKYGAIRDQVFELFKTETIGGMVEKIKESKGKIHL